MLQPCVFLDTEHLGSLESTQEATVVLGCALSNSYASFVLSLNFPCAQYLDIRPLTHELIVKHYNTHLSPQFRGNFCAVFSVPITVHDCLQRIRVRNNYKQVVLLQNVRVRN